MCGIAGKRRVQPKDHNLRVAAGVKNVGGFLSSAQCAAYYMHDVQINVLPGCNEKSYLALTERAHNLLRVLWEAERNNTIIMFLQRARVRERIKSERETHRRTYINKACECIDARAARRPPSVDSLTD